VSPRAGSSAAIHNLGVNMVKRKKSIIHDDGVVLRNQQQCHYKLCVRFVYFGQRMKGIETVAPNIVR